MPIVQSKEQFAGAVWKQINNRERLSSEVDYEQLDKNFL